MRFRENQPAYWKAFYNGSYGMRLLELTLPTPAENLALDEALLAEAEENFSGALGPLHETPSRETLRIWELPKPAVVLGRSSKLADEVNMAACARRRVPILRRPSGGATVVIGPGCLMYSLLLGLESRPMLRSAIEAHRFVLERLGRELRLAIDGKNLPGNSAGGIAFRGTSDLAFGRPLRKFSGNSIRYGRDSLLYHGTILYDFDIGLITSLLPHPPLAPQYRGHRPHDEFLANLPLRADDIRRALIAAWISNQTATDSAAIDWPKARVAALVERRYSRVEWNERR